MKAADVRVGEIVIFYNTLMNPPKDKFAVCIAPSSFFVINTKRDWEPAVQIFKADYPFLSYDSYVGCGLVCEFPPDRFIPDNARRGSVTPDTIKAIIAAIGVAKALTPIQKRTLTASLQGVLKPS